MTLRWTQELATGEPEIDSQHQELIERLSRLVDACECGRGRDEVQHTLAFLEEYVLAHFRAEEALMARHDFPELGAHQAQHRLLVERVQALKAELDSAGTSLPLVVNVNRLLVDWLKQHMQVWDKAVAVYLRAHP